METSRYDCWYTGACDDEHTNCRDGCIVYKEMCYLMSHSNIPKKLQRPIPLYVPEKDTEAYYRLNDIKNDIKTFVRNGKSLYICSTTTGNGKTSWALKILMKYFDQIAYGNCFRVRGMFIPVTEFLLRNKNFKTEDHELEDMKYAIKTADLIVWDDIGSASLSAYDYDNILMYLDIREREGFSNIFTSNRTSMNDLTDAIGNKCASRVLSQDTEIVKFVGGGQR